MESATQSPKRAKRLELAPQWLRELILSKIEPCLPKEFVGNVQLNIYAGTVANVNVLQSFK